MDGTGGDAGSGGTEGATLAGRRVLVVGASSGIGAAIAEALVVDGANVALAARRLDLLVALLEPFDDRTRRRCHAMRCDVRSPVEIESMVRGAVAALGGLDAVVYATGINHLAMLEETTADDWRALFETNVIGASLVAREALAAMRSAMPPFAAELAGGATGPLPAPSPRMVFLSSHSVPRPWPALGAYAASKAALDTMVRAWQIEVPEVTFARLVVGPTMTPMAEGWDVDRSAVMFDRWAADGLFDGIVPVEPAVVATTVLGWLAAADPPTDLHMPNAVIDSDGAVATA